MTCVIKSLLVCVIFVALMVSPGAIMANEVITGDKVTLDRAEKLIDENNYSEAIAPLESMESKDLTSDLSARTRFLLGLATYNQTNNEIVANRQKGLQKWDVLQEQQIEPMKSALSNFQVAYAIGPERELAAECLFMAGKMLDWGHLQRFKEALDTYKMAADLYSETEFGKKSQERYERLSSMMSPHGKRSPHKPKGSSKSTSPH